jgi:SAM-dependent methyltransferase
MKLGKPMSQQILQTYADAAARLIERYEAISPADQFAPVLPFLTGSPGRLIDIGAGTGRDAAWFASKGFDVLAVEPVAEFRAAGLSLHQSPSIEWLDDSLPKLSFALRRSQTFDIVIVNGVWQHIDPDERRIAMPAIAALTSTGGCLVLSLRHGPGVPGRLVFEPTVEEAIDLACANGFRLLSSEPRESIGDWNQAAGVTWTWMVFCLTA